MIFHEDELISLNTPTKSTNSVSLHCHRNPVLTMEIMSSEHVADTQAFLMIWFSLVILFYFFPGLSTRPSESCELWKLKNAFREFL